MLCVCCAEEQGPEVVEIKLNSAFTGRAPPDEEPKLTPTQNAGFIVQRAATDFIALVDRGCISNNFGWTLDLMNETSLHIHALRSGSTPLQAYNSTASRGQELRVGDAIVAVDGRGGSAGELSEAIKARAQVELRVRRPMRFMCLTVRPASQPMGLQINYEETGSSLFIRSVGPGFISDSGLDIRAGDRIHSVSGVKGRPEALLKALRDETTLVLVLTRV
mmetsp:Transcript_64397/g.186646  ORF Transcript_64397/g.186646 Transcript_64397/m.186646 type:complete len:220 (+) Transcript_64397:109-768(+)